MENLKEIYESIERENNVIEFFNSKIKENTILLEQYNNVKRYVDLLKTKEVTSATFKEHIMKQLELNTQIMVRIANKIASNNDTLDACREEIKVLTK